MSSLYVYPVSMIVDDDPVNLIMVFEQRAPSQPDQWSELPDLGVENLEEKMDMSLLAANFWRDGAEDIENVS